MKLQRHAAILRIIREQRIPNQDALKRALASAGITVAQATLSRDIRELGLTKQADPAGGSFYSASADGTARPDLAGILGTLLMSLDGVGPLLVARTLAGGAEAVATAIGQAGWKEVLGTTVGPDTVVIVTRGEQASAAVVKRLEGIARK